MGVSFLNHLVALDSSISSNMQWIRLHPLAIRTHVQRLCRIIIKAYWVILALYILETSGAYQESQE